MGLSKKIARRVKDEQDNKAAKANRQISNAAALAVQVIAKEREQAARLYRREQAQMELSMMNQVMAMFLYILHDKHGYGQKRLTGLYNEVCDLAKVMEEMRAEGDSDPVTIYSVLEVLKDECDLVINPPNTPLPVIMGGKSLGEDSFGNIKWGDVDEP